MKVGAARKLYKGKYFYEVRRSQFGDSFLVNGPLSTIRYIAKPKAFSNRFGYGPEYKFVQVIDGRVVQAFTKDEILVTTRPLGGVIP